MRVGFLACRTHVPSDGGRLGDSDIASADHSLDGGAFMGMVASDAAFDEVSEDVEVSFNAPGSRRDIQPTDSPASA